MERLIEEKGIGNALSYGELIDVLEKTSTLNSQQAEKLK